MATTNLLFRKATYTGGPINLVFGDTGGEAPARPSEIGGSAPLVVRTRLGGFGTIDYDNRNPRRASTARLSEPGRSSSRKLSNSSSPPDTRHRLA